MEENVKVVLFDLGRVLLDFDHMRAAERISCFCEKKPKEIYDLFFESKATVAFEAGKIAPGDFYQEVKSMLGLKLSYESFVPIWNEIFFLSPNNRSVFKLVNSLRVKYKTALLSNINSLHYDYVKKNFPVLSGFDRIFLSFQMGSIKPQREIYEKVIEELNVLPWEIFYTDDRIELIDSAKALGIRGHCFKDFKQLTGALEKEKIGLNF